jgi:hypothetical protein
LNYLHAAIDESENGYYAIVIGDKGAIERQVRKLPKHFTHMVSWYGGDYEKKQILSNLDFEGNILVHCVKFGLKALKVKIQDSMLSGRCRMPSIKINNIIGYEMARTIDKFYYKFALNNHFQVTALTFVVDNEELINYLKNGHGAVKKYGDTKDAHTIADCVAYANYHGWTISPKVIEHHGDFEEMFHSSILNIIQKK